MTKNSTKKIPRLRFKGFEGEWEEKRLNDFIRILNGLTYSPNDIRKMGTFVIRSSNINNDHIVNSDNVYVDNSVINAENVKTNDIVIVVRNGSRKLIGKHALVVNKMNKTVVGAFMSILRGRNGKFINSLLSTENFSKEVHKSLGATINQITKKDFSLMKFYIPNDQEQQKIGSFFSKLDQLIDLQSKKVEQLKKLKRGYLQKMFPQKGESIPRFRFDGFSGEWEENKLEDAINPVNENKVDNPNKYNLLKVQLHFKGAIKTNDHPRNTNNGRPYYLRKPGELIIGRQNFHHGGIAITDENISNCVASNAIQSFTFNNTNPQYIYNYISRKDWLKRTTVYINGTGQKEYSLKTLNNLKILLPTKIEQNCIGKYFSILSKNVELEENKLNKLNSLKKAYLQKIFF